MYNPKKELAPGTQVRVEQNAVIIGLVDKDNPYWYEVEFADGHRETVSVGRISWCNDRMSAVCENDGSVAIFSPKLSPQGAIDLYHWLRTNLPALELHTANDSPNNEAEG